MTRQSAVHVMAGLMVLTSVVLTYAVSQWWLLLATFVGLNLTQWGFTGFCPAEKILGWLGVKDGCCCEKTVQRAEL